jgi:hypothetical protein
LGEEKNMGERKASKALEGKVPHRAMAVFWIIFLNSLKGAFAKG